jgi:hypothetical protein
MSTLQKRTLGKSIIIGILALSFALVVASKFVDFGDWQIVVQVFLCGYTPIAAFVGAFYYVLDSFLA